MRKKKVKNIASQGPELRLFDEEITSESTESICGDDVEYTFITKMSQVEEVIDTLSSASILAYDLEFTDLNAWYSHQLLWQLSDSTHNFVGVTDLVPLVELAPLLCTKPLIAHNANAEYKQTLVSTLGKIKLPLLIDTMLAYQVNKAGLLEFEAKATSNLEDVLFQYLGAKLAKDTRKEFIEHPWAKFYDDYVKNTPPYSDQDYNINYLSEQAYKYFPRRQRIYAANDVRYQHKLWYKLREELYAKELYEVAMREFGLIQCFGDMDLTGMTVNPVLWRETLLTIGGPNYPEEIGGECGEIVERTKPILLAAWNKLESKNKFDYVSKRSKGTVANVRANRSRADLDKFNTEDVQYRLLQVGHDDINMRSHVQVQDALYGLGIDLETMDKDAMKVALEKKLPEEKVQVLEDLLQLSMLSKLISTYGEKILVKISSENTLWASVKQLGTSATGRISSAAPNLTNLPSRGKLGKQFRSFFVAAPGCKLVIADYSALEQRIAAHVSQDPAMLRIFREGLDMHGMSAAGIFHLDYNEFETAGKYDRATGEYEDKSAKLSNGLTINYMRDEVAKTCSFAANYGGNGVTLNRTLRDKSEKECEEIYSSYVKTYQPLFSFMESFGNAAILYGVTTNLGGRKRFYRANEKWDKMPPFRAYNPQSKGAINAIRRQGLNAPIQSLAADIVKLAMGLIHSELQYRNLLKVWGPNGAIIGTRGPGTSITNQVHDELVLRCDEEIAEVIQELVERNMLTAERFYIPTVPASCTCHIGDSWADK